MWKSLFKPESHTINPAGVYKLRLCKNGQWQDVTVDDQFPCYAESSQRGRGPMFSQASRGDIWVLKRGY